MSHVNKTWKLSQFLLFISYFLPKKKTNCYLESISDEIKNKNLGVCSTCLFDFIYKCVAESL